MNNFHKYYIEIKKFVSLVIKIKSNGNLIEVGENSENNQLEVKKNSENSQLEKRLKELEDKFKEIDVQKDIYDGNHKKYLNYITIIFGIAAFFFTAAAVVMGFFSYRTSSDINDAISKMQTTTTALSNQVYNHLIEMQKEGTTFHSEIQDKFYSTSDRIDTKFENLTNKINNKTESTLNQMKVEVKELKNEFKIAKIDISYDGEAVINNTIVVKSTTTDPSGITYIIKDIKLTNNGSATAYITLVQFKSSKNIVKLKSGNWISSDPSILPIQMVWQIGRVAAILSPQQSQTIDELSLSTTADYMEGELTIFFDPAPVKIKIIFEK